MTPQVKTIRSKKSAPVVTTGVNGSGGSGVDGSGGGGVNGSGGAAVGEPTRRRGRPSMPRSADSPHKAVKRRRPTGVVGAQVTSDELSEPGTLIAWGSGMMGQLGLGPDVVEKKRPARVLQGTKFVMAAVGGLHTVAMSLDPNRQDDDPEKRKLLSCGCNDDGALGRQTDEEEDAFEMKPVDVSSFGLGPGVRICKVVAGDAHTAVLTSNGKVFYWGTFRGIDGSIGLKVPKQKEFRPVELELDPTGYKDDDRFFVAIASGNTHLVVVSHSGKAFTVGAYDGGQLGRISTRHCFEHEGKPIDAAIKPQEVRGTKKKLPKFAECFATGFATYLKTVDGNLFACGNNKSRQLGVGAKNKFSGPDAGWMAEWALPCKTLDDLRASAMGSFSWVKIVGGRDHTIFMTDDGKAWALGTIEGCGDPTAPTHESLGRFVQTPVALHRIIAASVGVATPVLIKDIAASDMVSFAIVEYKDEDSDDEDAPVRALFAWGAQNSSQLGHSGDEDWPTPKRVNMGSVVPVRIYAGGQHCALLGKETKAEFM